MDALLKKREEMLAKIEALKAAHKAEIDAKVNAYRLQLEQEFTTPEIESCEKVLDAINTLLATEPAETIKTDIAEEQHKEVETEHQVEVQETPTDNNTATVVIEVAKPIAETLIATTEAKIVNTARPGMPTIEIPERR